MQKSFESFTKNGQFNVFMLFFTNGYMYLARLKYTNEQDGAH